MDASSYLYDPLTFHLEGLSTFLGEHVTVFVLDHAVEVQTGDSLSDSRLPNAQRNIAFYALPEVPFQ